MKSEQVRCRRGRRFENTRLRRMLYLFTITLYLLPQIKILPPNNCVPQSWDESMCVHTSWCHPRSGMISPLCSVLPGRCVGSAGVLPPVLLARGFQPVSPLSVAAHRATAPVSWPVWNLSQALLGPDHFSPVQIASLQTQNQHFGRGQIGGAGHIVAVA